MEIEAKPLLEEELMDGAALVAVQSQRRRKKVLSWAWTFATHSFIAAVVVAMLFLPSVRDRLWFRNRRDAAPRPTLYSPVTPAIEYVIDKPAEDIWNNGLYFGEPSEESERAWNDMIHPHGIQIYPEEAQHFPELNSVQLENGNYLFILGLYHNLHCLRRIRQTLWKEHYYPNFTATDIEHDREHGLHCLESLRTSMLCHPDLTPNRYYWSNRRWHDLSVKPDVVRECVNWERLEGFMKARAYDPADAVHEGIRQGEWKYDSDHEW